jgi:hypothetical protein
MNKKTEDFMDMFNNITKPKKEESQKVKDKKDTINKLLSFCKDIDNK